MSKPHSQGSKEQRAKWHRTYLSRGDNAERKNRANREAYHYRKSLGICPIAGCTDDPPPGHVLCAKHSKGVTKFAA